MHAEPFILCSFFVVVLLNPIVEKQYCLSEIRDAYRRCSTSVELNPPIIDTVDEADSFHYISNARVKRQLPDDLPQSKINEKAPFEDGGSVLSTSVFVSLNDTSFQTTSNGETNEVLEPTYSPTKLPSSLIVTNFEVTSTDANVVDIYGASPNAAFVDETQPMQLMKSLPTQNGFQNNRNSASSGDEEGSNFIYNGVVPSPTSVAERDSPDSLSSDHNTIPEVPGDFYASGKEIDDQKDPTSEGSRTTPSSPTLATHLISSTNQLRTTSMAIQDPMALENKEIDKVEAPDGHYLAPGPLTVRPLYPYSVSTSSSVNAISEANCAFGNARDVNLCQWMNLSLTREKWSPSRGKNYGWLGGPALDNTVGNDDGGYGLYETSKLVDSQFAQSLTFDSAMLISPIIHKTDAIGTCVDFWYAMDGLSQDRLRILMRPPSPQLEFAGRLNLTDNQLKKVFMESDGRDDIVLWENRDTTGGKWKNGQVVYSFNDRHMIIFEGIPLSISDPNRAYRGYIALDDFNFIDATDCKPFCNFEGGFCSWTQAQNDDFDWSLSRGSINPSTGPPMDRFSFNYGIKGGGYAYINSGYPRRPGDKARLLSDEFSPPGPDSPQCMRFWTHMFGNGVGVLRILLAPRNGPDEVIYELKGEQGNNWYQGQVTISSDANFQIVIEAEVGNNNLGDIAIDEISLKESACPTSPQSASKITGDCTFEVDECGWKNVDIRQRLDELDWERVVASQGRAPNSDHTLKTSLGSYMTLPRTTVQRGERGWLMSPPIKAKKPPYCISFWYYMYDPFIEQSGPSLGSLTVMMMEQDIQGTQVLKPLWELRNHQGPNWQYGQAAINTDKPFMVIFEGLWGNSRGSEFIAIDDISFFMGNCRTLPVQATANYLDCDFTRSSCAYFNATSTSGDSWLSASISRRPNTLADHTYGGPVGYIYFDVFNTNNVESPKMTLMSRVIPADRDKNPMCLSFWFAPIGNDPDTNLTINRESADASANDAAGRSGVPLLLWKVLARDVYKDRIEWMFGQVQIDTTTDFKISLVGAARKGGFAVDDIKVFPGSCRQRPSELDNLLPGTGG